VGAALGTGGGTVGTSLIRGKSGAVGSTQKGRDLNTRARSRSRGRTAIAWREDLEAQRRGLQAGVDSAIGSQNYKSVSGLAFDLNVEQDWEFVMIPPIVDARDEGSQSFGFGRRIEGRAGGGKEYAVADSFEDVGALGAAAGGFRGLPTASASSISAGLVGIGSKGVPGSTRDEPSFELDGEHVLDLPQSWCPRLVGRRVWWSLYLPANFRVDSSLLPCRHSIATSPRSPSAARTRVLLTTSGPEWRLSYRTHTRQA
jgi:hypothetical protein